MKTSIKRPPVEMKIQCISLETILKSHNCWLIYCIWQYGETKIKTPWECRQSITRLF